MKKFLISNHCIPNNICLITFYFIHIIIQYSYYFEKVEQLSFSEIEPDFRTNSNWGILPKNKLSEILSNCFRLELNKMNYFHDSINKKESQASFDVNHLVETNDYGKAIFRSPYGPNFFMKAF